MITLKSDGREVKVGNEVCMYRHEKTFYNRPGLFLRIKASDPTWRKKLQLLMLIKSIMSVWTFHWTDSQLKQMQICLPL